MAMTTSNVKATLVKSFVEGLGVGKDDWQAIFNLYTDDAASLRLAALTGVPNLPTWDGSADVTTNAPDSTGAVTLTYQGYGIQVVINKYDQKDIPLLAPGMTQKLGASVNNTFRNLAFTRLAAAFTDTVADGQYLCDTDHTRSTGTRSNKGGATLTLSNFESAILALREWTNYQNQPYDLVDVAPMYLVVPPELETAAKQIVGSSLTPGTGLGGLDAVNGINVSQGRATVIVSNELTDNNDWFIVFGGGFSPLNFWTRGAPDLTVSVDQDSKALKLTVDMAAVAASGPQPDGIHGSSI